MRMEPELPEGDPLSDQLGEVLVHCLKKGMEAPFTLATAGPGGGVLGLRFNWSSTHEGLNPAAIAEPVEGLGRALPIHIMLVDSKGDTALAIIERGGVKYLHCANSVR